MPKASTKKSGKSKKSGKKGPLTKEDPLETPFPFTCYDTEHIGTTIKLLASPEKHIVTKALIILDKYSLVKYENCAWICRLGTLPYLTELIKGNDVVILRLCLKLFNQLLKVPAFFENIIDVARTDDVKRLFDIFNQTVDPIVLEISSNVLLKLCKILDMIERIAGYDPQQKIVSSLKTSKDIDVQFNCLSILRCLCDLNDGSEILKKGNFFTAKILVCYLKSTIQKIREISMDDLVQISKWKDEETQKDMRQSGVLEAMLNTIMNHEKETQEMVDKAYEVLTNCVRNDTENSSHLINCLDFFKFCYFVENFDCRPNHLTACAIIFQILTASSKENRKILFDLSVHETILSLLRSDDPFVSMKVYECINNMGVNVFCSEAMLTPAVLEKILGTIKDRKLNLVPYKETALETVRNFFFRNPGSFKMLLRLNGTYPIMDIFQDDNAHDCRSVMSTIMDIMITIAYRDEARNILIELGIYKTLLKFYAGKDVILSTKALHIMNQYVDVTECRQYFLDLNGIDELLKVIAQKPSEYVLKETLLFARNMIKYRKVGEKFLLSGFLPALKKLASNENNSYLYKSTIDLLLDLHLPLKFNEKGRLEITDLTRDRFYMIRDGYKENFPFLELQEHQRLSPIFVVYFTDFSCPAALTVPVPDNKQRMSTLISTINVNDDKASEVGTDPGDDEEDIGTLKARLGVPVIYEYITPPLKFGFVSPDPYLARYLDAAKNALFGSNNTIIYCYEHKVKELARLVCKQIFLSKQYIGHWEHGYEVHQEEMKRRLGTNVIPLGYVRIGAMCERALLFKVLADRLNIPCTLVRGHHYVYYNEIFLMDSLDLTDDSTVPNPTENQFYYIVDLMEKPGQFYRVGSPEAENYVEAKMKPELNKEMVEYVHTFGLDW